MALKGQTDHSQKTTQAGEDNAINHTPTFKKDFGVVA